MMPPQNIGGHNHIRGLTVVDASSTALGIDYYR